MTRQLSSALAKTLAKFCFNSIQEITDSHSTEDYHKPEKFSILHNYETQLLNERECISTTNLDQVFLENVDPIRNSIKIVIVETHAHYRDILRQSVELQHAFIVIFESETPKEILENIKLFQHDIVLLELRLSVDDGAIAFKRVKEFFSKQKVVIITNFAGEVVNKTIGTPKLDGVLPKHVAQEILRNTFSEIYLR